MYLVYSCFSSFLQQYNINPPPSEASALSERLPPLQCQNCSICDCVCTILIDAGLPPFLFAEAVNYIVYTKNHNSTSTLTNTTPYKVQFNKKPDISRLP